MGILLSGIGPFNVESGSRLTYVSVSRTVVHEQHLDTTLTGELNLGLLNPALAGRAYTFPVRAVGYADLEQETMTAYEINLPPRHRVNAGVNVSYGRTFGSLSVSFTDEAFWQDVLDVRFHGETEPYTLVNGSAGVRWANNRIVTSVKALNLANRAVMQHVLGDVLKRQVVAEVSFGF